MKKIISVLAAAAAVLAITALVGCAEKRPAADDVELTVQSGEDYCALDDVYAQINELDILPEMYIMDEAYIQGYYGIAPEAVADKVFAVADDALVADTVIIVRVTEEGDEEAICSGFQTINNQRLAEMESYNPEQYARASEAEIGVSGDYVWYIITDNNDSVIDIIENNIG